VVLFICIQDTAGGGLLEAQADAGTSILDTTRKTTAKTIAGSPSGMTTRKTTCNSRSLRDDNKKINGKCKSNS
jgi:hypothetical protein